MNTVSSVLLTAGAVVAANIIGNKPVVTARQVIGTGVYLLMLAAINESAPEIASKIALLVLITALFYYLPTIVKGTGLSR